MNRLDARKILLGLAAPLLAVVVAFLIVSLILLLAGDPVMGVWQEMAKPVKPRALVGIVNAAIVYYLSACAVAIGFRMNLFNIGVEGQYRIASFAAAVVAGQGFLPGPLNILLALVVAMVSGGLWAGIAGWLKVTRGVSEVISTIMLNSLATALVAWLLGYAKDTSAGAGSNVTNTKQIAESSRVPGLSLISGTSQKVYGLLILAILIGLLYWLIINKTRFGFDLRAAGTSETAAVASGVDVKRMVITTMVISGMVAGLVGMPLLFGQDYSYGTTFQPGLGFAGIGIALLGRNHPIGMAVGALVWAFLDAQSNGLQINVGVATELVAIIQGVIVLAVVIAYELIRRLSVRMEQANVARQLTATSGPNPPSSTTTGSTGTGATLAEGAGA